jgi:hypothetical protein
VKEAKNAMNNWPWSEENPEGRNLSSPDIADIVRKTIDLAETFPPFSSDRLRHMRYVWRN